MSDVKYNELYMGYNCNINKRTYKKKLKSTGIKPWLLSKCTLKTKFLIGSRIDSTTTKHVSSSKWGNDQDIVNELFDLLALNTINDNNFDTKVDILTFLESSHKFIEQNSQDDRYYLSRGISIITKFSEYPKNIFPIEMNTAVTQNNLSVADIDIFNKPFDELYTSDEIESESFIKFSVTFNKQDFLNHPCCNEVFEKASKILGISDLESFTQDFIIFHVKAALYPKFDPFGIFDYNELKRSQVYIYAEIQWWISDVDYKEEFQKLLKDNNIYNLFKDNGDIDRLLNLASVDGIFDSNIFHVLDREYDSCVSALKSKYYHNVDCSNPWYYNGYGQLFARHGLRVLEPEFKFKTEPELTDEGIEKIQALNFGLGIKDIDNNPSIQRLVDKQRLERLGEQYALDASVFTDKLVSNPENVYTMQHRFGEISGISGGCFPVMAGDGVIKHVCVLSSDILNNTDTIFKALTSLISSTVETLFTNWITTLGDNGYITDASRVTDIIILQPFNSADDLRRTSSLDYSLNCVVVSLMYSIPDVGGPYIEISDVCNDINNVKSIYEISSWYKLLNKLATATDVEHNTVRLRFDLESIKVDNIKKYIYDTSTNNYMLYMDIPFVTVLTAVIRALTSTQQFGVHPNTYLDNTESGYPTRFSAKFYLRPATLVVSKGSQLLK